MYISRNIKLKVGVQNAKEVYCKSTHCRPPSSEGYQHIIIIIILHISRRVQNENATHNRSPYAYLYQLAVSRLCYIAPNHVLKNSDVQCSAGILEYLDMQ